ncbi:hypothetical protein ACFQX6_55340 [Streptosporangium lutulentum]
MGQIGAFLLFLDSSPAKWTRLAGKTDAEVSDRLNEELASQGLPGTPSAVGAIPLLRAVAELAGSGAPRRPSASSTNAIWRPIPDGWRRCWRMSPS